MENRQKELLQYIVEEYVASAQPVGSNLISERYMTSISSPTVRNAMQELERQGLIRAPHTSAGRIPTEAGYRFYIENLLGLRELSAKRQATLSEALKSSRQFEDKVKSLAKKTAELAHAAVVVGFNPHNVYYTGLSNIFSQPEFLSHNLVLGLSQVVDHLDEVMSKIHKQLDDEISVLLGEDNPFGQECGSVLTSWSFNGGLGVLGILGPMRMNYGENIAYIKFVKKLLEK